MKSDIFLPETQFYVLKTGSHELNRPVSLRRLSTRAFLGAEQPYLLALGKVALCGILGLLMGLLAGVQF